MAENWLEKGETHRALAFQIAHKAMKEAEHEAPDIRHWQDLEMADKMARRAAGLESGDTSKVNVRLQLVNQRILAMQLADE
jgi:hypothetical protein